MASLIVLWLVFSKLLSLSLLFCSVEISKNIPRKFEKGWKKLRKIKKLRMFDKNLANWGKLRKAISASVILPGLQTFSISDLTFPITSVDPHWPHMSSHWLSPNCNPPDILKILQWFSPFSESNILTSLQCHLQAAVSAMANCILCSQMGVNS